ncbi:MULTISPECIES: glycoside hydrolase family 36 protein [Flavobacteriaceae]|uniref:glycoside hydrolase family 36 protein n=1 Tax=Flavobacteriaceae TaxID=49546 RepID=UPI001490959D|nr:MULTISPECIES: glycoside hydrolase family 36 protein [Allomuricauda]MDC6366806.1 alpha-galactosidase [Muricauda sp. AC10]
MNRIVLILAIYVLGCQPQKEETPLSIRSGELTFEVNAQMHTKISNGAKGAKPLMLDYQPSETLELDDGTIYGFQVIKVQEDSIMGPLSGKIWTIHGQHRSKKGSIDKKLQLRTYKGYSNLITTRVTYTNRSDRSVVVENYANNTYEIVGQNDSPPFWAFQGSSSSKRDDWIKPLRAGYYQKNYMGMNDTDYGGGVPVTSIWRKDINIAIGHVATEPQRVSLPTLVESKPIKAKIGVLKTFDTRTLLKPNDSLQTLETFVSMDKGDYFNNLRKYSNLMQAKGIKMAKPEPAAFEPIWCAWGYGKNFSTNELLATLPKVKELGIKWAVLDDGFQTAEGDWRPNPEKFPKGGKEIKSIVDKIHGYGLKAKIWWTPLAADPDSKILKELPETKIIQKNGAPQYINWWDAHYLSPTKTGTIAHTQETVKMFMDEWGFDGLKMDGQHLNAVAPDHSLKRPEDSFEGLPQYFQMLYDLAHKIKPYAVVENCPCGTCMSFFNMASMNQAVASDPLNSWQIRHKGKTYHALVPQVAYYGDHVELSDNGDDFASSFGVGAVLGTKFVWPKNDRIANSKSLLTSEKEVVWKKWFSLYNQLMLSKGTYLGDLYDIGYHKPESHAIRKDGKMYYAFYAKEWTGPVPLRGLNPDLIYTVKDYFNQKDLGEIKGDNFVVSLDFKEFFLLEVAEK